MKCCLCNEICKWLDFLVFSDENKKNRTSHLTGLSLIWLLWDVNYTHTKRVGDVNPGSVVISFPGMGGLDRNV